MYVGNVLWLGIQTLHKVRLRLQKLPASAKDLAHNGAEFRIIGIVCQSSLCYLKSLIDLVIGKQCERQAEKGTSIIGLKGQGLSIFLFGVWKTLALSRDVSQQDVQLGGSGIHFAGTRESFGCKLLRRLCFPVQPLGLCSRVHGQLRRGIERISVPT